jgi:hypothetical protein
LSDFSGQVRDLRATVQFSIVPNLWQAGYPICARSGSGRAWPKLRLPGLQVPSGIDPPGRSEAIRMFVELGLKVKN